MGRNPDKDNPFVSAIKESVQFSRDRNKKQFELKKAIHRFVWGAGIIFALMPVIVSLLGKILHSDNSELVERYETFVSNFFYSGSFLWLSITVLVMSLLDLLLFGMKKTDSQKDEYHYKVFALLATVLSAVGVWIYIDNIGNPISEYTMLAISIIAFILFAISSGIVSFKIVKEG